MSTQRIDLLLKKVRRETGNEDYGPNAGIGDTQIVSYFNDALSFLERGINSACRGRFKATTQIDLVAGTSSYDLPSNYLQSGGVLNVWYAMNDPASNDPGWTPLKFITDLESNTGGRYDVPNAYEVVNNQIRLKQTPVNNKADALKVEYVKRLNRLDIRRGKVSAVTLNGGTNTITSLTLNVATVPDPDEFELNELCCVVDADGNIKMKGIKIDGDLTAGAVPVRSDFVYETGETIAVGNYVVFGRQSSSHQLELDETIESFLTSFVAWKIEQEDSNSDASGKLQEFTATRDSILEAYAIPNQDLILIPEV